MKKYMRVASENSDETMGLDGAVEQRIPHPINLPVTKMGQEMKGISSTNEQDRVLRTSPMTESSLSILGAGSPYRIQGEV